MSALRAVRRGLCPVCRSGPIFAGRWRMNESCPVCGNRFERAPGYFVGAMYISYAFAVLFLIALVGLVQLPPFRSWPLALVVGLAVAAYLALVPVIFRWSRILWIHLGESMDW